MPDPTPDPAATIGGVVSVAGRDFLARKLTVEGELALLAALRGLADRQAGPGGLFERMAGKLKFLADTKQFAVLNRVVDRLTEIEAAGAGVGEDAVYACRQTPAGAALELFHRTRLTHPDVSLREFEAIVTAANAVETSHRLDLAVSDQKKAGAPSGSPTP